MRSPFRQPPYRALPVLPRSFPYPYLVQPFCGVRFTVVATLLLGCAIETTHAQAGADEALILRLTPQLQPAARGAAGARAPVIVKAREIQAQPDLKAQADGEVELRSAGVVLRADSLSYEQADDLAVARGNVRVSRDGNIYSGPELQLQLQRFEGFFVKPSYRFARSGAGGSAQRIDFLDDQRIIATGANYSSCLRNGTNDPDWLLSTDSIKLDFAANEGIAENAVLRFYGVPILAAPVLSFPLNDESFTVGLEASLSMIVKRTFARSGAANVRPRCWHSLTSKGGSPSTKLTNSRRAFFEWLSIGKMLWNAACRPSLLRASGATNSCRNAA